MVNRDLINTKVTKWFESISKLKGEYYGELSQAEQSIIDSLQDYWREIDHIYPDDKKDLEDWIEALNGFKKSHASNRDIVTQCNNVRTVVKQVFLKDDETYQIFRDLAKKYAKEHRLAPVMPTTRAPQQPPRQTSSTPRPQQVSRPAQTGHTGTSPESSLSPTGRAENEQASIDFLRTLESAGNPNHPLNYMSDETLRHLENAANELAAHTRRNAEEISRSINNGNGSRPQQSRPANNNGGGATIGSTTTTSSGKGGCMKYILIIAAIYAVIKFWPTITGWFSSNDNNEKNAQNTEYVIAEAMNLRATPDGEIIGRATYATPVEILGYGTGDWVQVKTDGQIGYISMSGIASSEDFNRLNSIWGDEATRESIVEIRFRRALVDFCNANHLSPNYQLYGNDKKGRNVWTSKKLGGKEVFAFILDDKSTGSRWASIYTFDKDGNFGCELSDGSVGTNKFIKRIKVGRHGLYSFEYGKDNTIENSTTNIEADVSSLSASESTMINIVSYKPTPRASRCKLTKIEVSPSETRIYGYYVALNSGTTIWWNQTAYIVVDGGEHLMIRNTEGVPMAPNKASLSSGERKNFVLIFPPLPSGTTQFDFLESDDADSWRFYDIKLDRAI